MALSSIGAKTVWGIPPDGVEERSMRLEPPDKDPTERVEGQGGGRTTRRALALKPLPSGLQKVLGFWVILLPARKGMEGE